MNPQFKKQLNEDILLFDEWHNTTEGEKGVKVTRFEYIKNKGLNFYAIHWTQKNMIAGMQKYLLLTTFPSCYRTVHKSSNVIDSDKFYPVKAAIESTKTWIDVIKMQLETN